MSLAETWRHNTTLRDLTDADNVLQARHELRRAASTDALADWARRWGEPAMTALGQQADGEEAIEATNQEATEAEEALCRIKGRCDEADKLLETASDLVEERKHDEAIRLIGEVQALLGEAA